MSPEFQKLVALRVPDIVRPGDMWHCQRLGIVSLTLAHKQGKRHPGHTHVFLYHWGKPSLRARTPDLQDYHPNAGAAFNPVRAALGEQWDYVGNLFDLLPYTTLTNAPPFSWA